MTSHRSISINTTDSMTEVNLKITYDRCNLLGMDHQCAPNP